MIQAHGLRKTYSGAAVLEDVSFELGRGQALVLLGPNGAGKTTLLRILATLTRASAGRLSIGGADAARNLEAVRRQVGVVGHGAWVYEELTALENLRFWTVMRGGDASPARLHAALEQLDLDDVAHERARTFSAGMKRRLALARVALEQPRVLLLDEPFTGLDQQGRKWLAEHLLGFKSGGGAVVLATHSLAGGLGVADRVGILHGGRLLLERAAADLSLEDLRRLYDSLTEGGSVAA